MTRGKYLALTGGVGGAKLALGLTDILTAEQLEIVVNTADDFCHLGLNICPDIDTLLYTLSEQNNQQLGWGLAGESWAAMDALERLGGETWFRLGDRDLATHLWRTQALSAGAGLSEVTLDLAKRMGIAHRVHPMTNDPVRTLVHSDEGDLPFQHYFVRRQCEPAVSGFSFRGLDAASVNPAVSKLLVGKKIGGIVICPSNPFVSVDPILKLPGLYEALIEFQIPVVAVSPIVAGMAIKGPAAKMMGELNMPVTALAVAQHYAQQYPGLLKHFVIDQSDVTLVPQINELGIAAVTTATIMNTRQDKKALADFVLHLMES
ncbi:MAG: LPPG:FO 2-phospho-L-lactate transferase [Halioglobus sp.]|jgi:LPPG:FO 2-phospho-L-lactate transferase